MKRHIKERHLNKGKFECPDCNGNFSRAEHLRNHRKRCLKKEVKAENEFLVVEAENEEQLNNELWCIEIDE